MTEQNAPEVVPDQSSNDGVIVARAYRNYRLIRYALIIFLFGYGLLSIQDGFFKWPAENRAAKSKGLEDLPHPGYDIQFNQVFGVVLPPLSLALLAIFLYVSRGEFRFDGNALNAPGHPPVPLSAITEIDRSKWDRKSVAHIRYTIPETGHSGRIRMDHSRYDPVDKLFRAVEAAAQTPQEPE